MIVPLFLSFVSFFGTGLSLRGPSAPTCGTDQVRLSLTRAQDGSEMGISWATNASLTPSDYSGYVVYGTTPGSLTMTSPIADTRNYTLCDLPSPSLHFTVLSGLHANSQYYYSIVEPRCGATEPVRFSAPRVVGATSSAYPLRVFTYADMGISYSQNTATLIAERVANGTGPDVVVHAGDIAYADNRGCPLYDSVLNTYYNEISPYASVVPVMFSSGNHEAFGADAEGGFLAYRKRVAPTMPILNATATPFFYSFNVGRIHFLSFDIDQTHSVDSPQYAFIAADLVAVDRTLTPIVVAFNHFPFLCSNEFWCNDGSGDAQAFRALYEPLFNAPETRVHVYVAGHVHAAEVDFPFATGSLKKTSDDWQGLTTVFNIMLGFPGDEEVCCNKWQQPFPDYVAWRTDDVAGDGGTFGFGELIFESDTTMTLNVWSAVNRSIIFTNSVSFA